jgi:acetyl-CoA carboxylase biotin carboxyl carrier protein
MSDHTASAQAAEEAPKNEGTRRRKHQRRHHQEASLNMGELRELAELVNEHGFTDFEFENQNIRVRLSKATAPVYAAAPQPAAPTAPQAAPAAETAAPAASEDEGLHIITSPIVGTFYRAPGPDKDPYVSEGSKVSPESVVCIVEAMKLMNEIQAETSGEVVKIFAENGQPVEYGQPLFGIK